MQQDLQQRYDALVEHLRGYKRAAVVFTGGIDSALVAAALLQAVGPENALAITYVTNMHPAREVLAAAEIAQKIGIRQVECRVDVFAYPTIIKNSAKRCYYCKRILYSAMLQEAERQGFDVLLDDADLDDTTANRAGRMAIEEMHIPSPLVDLGFAKADVQTIAAEMNIAGIDRMSMACLATRLPAGSPITPGKLAQIDSVETALLQMGYEGVRVRHHGDVARIEMRNKQDIARAALADNAAQIAAAVRQAGRFNFVTLDLEGYRRGSLNVLPTPDYDD